MSTNPASAEERRVQAAAPDEEWLSLPEAREILGLMSEEVARYWASRGYLRSRVLPGGELQVCRADVLYRQRAQADVAAYGDSRPTPGDELTAGELDALEGARPGRLPWQRTVNAHPAGVYPAG